MALHLAGRDDERLWQPYVAFDILAHRPYFDDDAWGASMASHVYGLPTNVRAHVRVAPEGLLLHADCERCSARDEVVLDFRSFEVEDPLTDLSPVELAVFGAERSRCLQHALWEEPLRQWASAHKECSPARPRPMLCADGARALGQVCDAAGAELRERGEVTPVAVAVPTGCAPVWFDFSGDAECDRMFLGFRMRESVARGSSVQTVVVAEEVPLPHGATALRVAVLTATGNWVGFGGIDRFDRPAPGRGVLQPIVWTRVRGSATWLDGLRARLDRFPVPRQLQRAEQ
ncbi:MAG TPA: hypothetical protein VF832_08250 [Longimicrobiales bacterium]